MLHQRFMEHRFLESTLELLQQFFIQVKSIAHDYKVFPGDQSTFSPKCFCCGKKVTPIERLGKVLFMTPLAICHHLKMLSSISLVNESLLFLKNMLVLFTSIKNYSASKRSFDNAVYKTAGDKADKLFHSKNSCTYHNLRIGEYCFCESMKVDLAESKDKRQKNHIRKKRNNFSSTFSSTMYLLCTLFEDLGSVTELHEKISNEDTELPSLDPRNYLINEQEEGDYLFCQGIINQASINDKDYLVLYESWCLFICREFYKNLLAILDEVHLQTFGEKQTGIPNKFCKVFDLHDDEKIQAYFMKLSNKTHSDFGLSYQTVMNNQSYTLCSEIT
jgi:hypothetical protein